MERIKGANGELMKYSMQPMDGKGHLTLYRYDQLAVGGADNAHLEFWQEIEELRKQRADAQATIAALQAVNKGLRTERDMLVADLTQRTAELEAANKHCEIIEERKAEAYKEVEIQLLAKANLQAELERVRGELVEAKDFLNTVTNDLNETAKERDDLRTLVLALPKVEGEIVAQAGYVKDRKKVYACFGSDADMTAYAALLTHRQGMEG